MRQAIITVYSFVGQPWNCVLPGKPFVHNYADLPALEKYCADLAGPDAVREISAFSDEGGALLVDLYKSEKKTVIIYPRSKFPRE